MASHGPMDMDYDDDYQTALRASTADKRAAPPVVVDDAHPFDLDAYIANYSGARAARPSRDRAALSPRAQAARRSTGCST
jgi:hypothetical protein